jgi:hypothetical protein
MYFVGRRYLCKLNRWAIICSSAFRHGVLPQLLPVNKPGLSVKEEFSVVVFRYKLWFRLLFLFLFLVLLAMAGWMGSMVVPMAARHLEPFMIDLVIVVVLVSLLVLLGIVLLGYVGFFYWTYRLEFGESRLQTRMIYHPFLRPFCCAYEDVVQIRRGMVRGLLEIVPRDGKPLQVGVRAFEEGGERLLDELSKRVDAERIAPDLGTSLWKYTWFDRLQLVFLVVILFFQVVNFYLLIGHNFVLGSVAWKSAWGGVLFNSVETFALDSDGTPWIVAESGSVDDCRVHHITHSGTQTWDLPDDVDGQLGCGFPRGVAQDGAGRPVVIYVDRLLHWDGEAWLREPFAPAESGLSVYPGWVASRDSQVWGTAETANGSESVLFGLDLSSGEWRVVPPPDSAVNDGLAMSYRFHQSADGSLLVLMTGENQVRLYLLRDGEWLEPGYPIFMPSPAGILDFATDSAGRIWLLLAVGSGKYALGRFDPETTAWDWGELESEQDLYRFYRSMEVDERGRVWLAGLASRKQSAGVATFAGLILDVFELTADGQARRIVCYTTDNSNYQSGYSMNYGGTHLGVDGRMWAAEDRLVWVDSTAHNLPDPLPDWIVAVTSGDARLILLSFSLVVLVMYAAVYALAQRARRRDA